MNLLVAIVFKDKHADSPVLFGDQRMAEAGGANNPASGGRAA